MTYDPSDNSFRCYELAVASLREINIRRRQILPLADRPDEVRWAREGEVPMKSLETLKRRQP